MSLTLYPVVGTIEITSGAFHGDGDRLDDSTLERLLASFAHRASLDDNARSEREATRFVSSRRFSWTPTKGGAVTVRANLAQLIESLQEQFDQLGPRNI